MRAEPAALSFAVKASSPPVHCDGTASRTPTAPEIRRVDERGAGGVQLRHESALRAAERGLKRVRCWEIGREGVARYVGVAGAVHGDAIAIVEAAATEVGGVDERGTGGVELRHKDVSVGAAACGLERVHCGK